MPAPSTMRSIVVDLDDTLNDFSQTLRSAAFPFDPSYALPEDRFRRYLADVQAQVPETGDLLSTEYSYFRFKIHERCFAAARPRPGAGAFMRRLRASGWRVVICTRRDLRRASGETHRWLAAHDMPFDHLFMTANKIAFCRAWGIPLLVDDDPFSIAHAAAYGIQLFYPAGEPREEAVASGPRPFRTFAEVESWIGV